MKRIFALIIPLWLGILACGAAQPAPDTSSAQTKAYLENMATALAGTLAAVVQPTSAAPPAAAAATAAPVETETAGPPTATLRPHYEPGSIPVGYGEKVGSIMRQETIVYGFQGTQGDNVGISLTLSNARPELSFCSKGFNLDFSLRDKQLVTLDTGHVAKNRSTTKYLLLPYSGEYYVSVTCIGSGCNAFCAEMSMVVNQK
jgi:hypothetical protein